MSPLFPSTGSTTDNEAQFGRTLTASGLHVDDVQCPHGDREAATRAMQQHAILINRRLGNEIINLSWKPDR